MKILSQIFSIFCLLFLSSLVFSSDTKLQQELIYFDNQMSNYSSTINSAKKYLDYYDASVIELEKNYKKNLHESKLLKQQLLFFLGATYRDPYEYRILSVGFLELIAQSKNNYTELEQVYKYHISVYDSIKVQYNALLGLIPLSEPYPISTEKIISIKDQFSEIISHTKMHIDILKPVVTEGKEYTKTLKAIYNNKIKSNALERLKLFFFNKSAMYYNKYYFNNLYNHSINIVTTIYNNLKYKTPSNYMDYIFGIVLLLLLRGSLYYLSIKLIMKYLFKNTLQFKLHQAFKVYGWYLIGLTFALCSAYYMFPYDIITYRIAVICYVKAVLEAVIFLKCYDKKVKLSFSSLRIYFCLFVYVIVFQELQIPPAFLILMWPAGLIVTIYIIFKKHKITNSKLSKLSLFFYSLFFSGLIILNFLNYVYLSVFIFILLFVFSIGLQFGSSITKVFKLNFERISYFTNKHFVSIIIKGVFIPLIWLVIIFFLFYWISYQLVAPTLIFHFLTKSIFIARNEIHIFDIVLLLLLLFMVISIKNMLRTAIKQFEFDGNIDKGVSESFRVLISYIFWVIYFLIALYFLNINIWGILIASGGLGIGIGFGLKDLANNFISGITLIITKTVQSGDVIKIHEMYGTVTKVNIRNTVLLSPKKHILTIPNSTIISNELINYKQTIRNQVSVNVSYNSDVSCVRKILNEIAENNKSLIWHVVRFSQIGDRSLNFVLYFKVDKMMHIYEAKDQITERVHQKFKEEGIEIFYPKLAINMAQENIQNEQI